MRCLDGSIDTTFDGNLFQNINTFLHAWNIILRRPLSICSVLYYLDSTHFNILHRPYPLDLCQPIAPNISPSPPTLQKLLPGVPQTPRSVERKEEESPKSIRRICGFLRFTWAWLKTPCHPSKPPSFFF